MPLFRRRRTMPKQTKRQTPIIGRQAPGASRQRNPRPVTMRGPGQEMQSRMAAAAGRGRIIRMSNLQQGAAVERRSWLGIPVIGSIVEWILNFVFRARRFEKGLKRSRPTPISSAMAKSRGKKRIAEQEGEFAKQRRQALEMSQRRQAA